MKKVKIALLSIGVLATTMITGCSSCNRKFKTIKSDISGGLDRVITVYDYNGNVLATYEGKIDIEENESKVYFDLKGKRVIIYNAIVITEEK